MFLSQGLRTRGQLPVETTSFVGREAELARLSVLLSQARLVTVTGPGGVGKTRLALRAAAKAAPGFADGTCLAELATVTEPGLLVPVVAGGCSASAGRTAAHSSTRFSPTWPTGSCC